MESVGNVSLERYFHSAKQPCEFPDMLCCPLVSCRSRWCAGGGELFSCGVRPLCGSSHPPPQDGTGGTLLHGAAPKHISGNTLHRHPWAAWEWGWTWDRRDNGNLSHELGSQD